MRRRKPLGGRRRRTRRGCREAERPRGRGAAVRSSIDAEASGPVPVGAGAHAPVEAQVFGMIYALPHELASVTGAELVESESAGGQALLRSFVDDGMPPGLREAGFLAPADFWPPWCAVRVGGEVASIAFAARLSEVGAEIGVTTAGAFRGRGLAATATAGWSRLQSLRSRTLFYSTARDNLSSQRVACRLGLRLHGASLRIC